jgi:hypothetical protein
MTMMKILAAMLAAATVAGCATESTTQGVAWGAGIGALVGGVAGGHGSDALIGAAVGAGIGYVVGNEQDKKKAQQMSDASRSKNYAHSEDTAPLGGTSWRLQDWSPKDAKADFRAKTFAFGRDGWVTTTTTYADGRIGMENENYRVVGNTLIVNKGDYLVNYRFTIQGDQLTADNSKLRAILRRM